MTATLHPAVFVDRDGTLNEMVFDETHGVMDSPFRPEQLTLKAHAAGFVRGVRELGFKVIVISNQPGIAKGTLTPACLAAIHDQLHHQLERQGARVDAVYHCPHHPEPGPGRAAHARACECRKPRPGLLLEAARVHRLDLARSFFVGDGLVDVEAGRAAGVTTLLVTRLKPELLERIQERPCERPHFHANDLAAALTIIREATHGLRAGS